MCGVSFHFHSQRMSPGSTNSAENPCQTLPAGYVPQSSRPFLSHHLCLPPTHDASLLIHPGIVEQAKEGQQVPSTAEDVQQSPQQPAIPALNDTDEIEQDTREEKKESPTGPVKENNTIQPGECRGVVHLALVTHWSSMSAIESKGSCFGGKKELHAEY